MGSLDGGVPEPTPRVLVASIDETLAHGLAAAGYSVRTASSAPEAIVLTRYQRPHCVVTDLELAGGGGLLLVRSLRAHPQSIGAVPIVLIVPASCPADRGELLRLGADLVERAGDHAAIAAGVVALCRLARRVRTGSGTRERPSLSGRLEIVSVAAVLHVLSMERRSGRFTVTAGGRSVVLRLVDGRALEEPPAVGAALATVRTMLAWPRGGFAFVPGDGASEHPSKPLAELLLEALRLQDEQRAAAAQRARRSICDPPVEHPDGREPRPPMPTLPLGEAGGAGIAAARLRDEAAEWNRLEVDAAVARYVAGWEAHRGRAHARLAKRKRS